MMKGKRTITFGPDLSSRERGRDGTKRSIRYDPSARTFSWGLEPEVYQRWKEKYGIPDKLRKALARLARKGRERG